MSGDHVHVLHLISASIGPGRRVEIADPSAIQVGDAVCLELPDNTRLLGRVTKKHDDVMGVELDAGRVELWRTTEPPLITAHPPMTVWRFAPQP